MPTLKKLSRLINKVMIRVFSSEVIKIFVRRGKSDHKYFEVKIENHQLVVFIF